jgi:hypothetical protein
MSHDANLDCFLLPIICTRCIVVSVYILAQEYLSFNLLYISLSLYLHSLSYISLSPPSLHLPPHLHLPCHLPLATARNQNPNVCHLSYPPCMVPITDYQCALRTKKTKTKQVCESNATNQIARNRLYCVI